MNIELKAIGAVLKEAIAEINSRIDAGQGVAADSLDSAENKMLDRMKAIIATAENLQEGIDQLKTITGLQADAFNELIKGAIDAATLNAQEYADSLDLGDIETAQNWVEGNQSAEHELYAHKGGLWRCSGTTLAEPGPDNARWVLLANGIHKSGMDQTGTSATITMELSDGTEQVIKISIPEPRYTNEVWEKGGAYALRDVVWRDGHSFIALVSGPAGQPGDSKEWAKYTMRGRAGRRGEKGEPGADGARGSDGAPGRAAPNTDEIRGLINKILEPGDNAEPVRQYRGAWSMDPTYQAGDLVTVGNGLYLCSATNEAKPPATAQDAGDYWRALVPPAGVGIGGGGSGAGIPVDGNEDTRRR